MSESISQETIDTAIAGLYQAASNSDRKGVAVYGYQGIDDSRRFNPGVRAYRPSHGTYLETGYCVRVGAKPNSYYMRGGDAYFSIEYEGDEYTSGIGVTLQERYVPKFTHEDQDAIDTLNERIDDRLSSLNLGRSCFIKFERIQAELLLKYLAYITVHRLLCPPKRKCPGTDAFIIIRKDGSYLLCVQYLPPRKNR